MNKIILKGRLTADPELRYINENISVTRFNIAVNRQKKKDGEQVTDFFNILAWNKQGEFIKNYFSKGQEILVVGRLETDKYIDKETLKTITKYEVVAEEVEFVGSKKESKELDFTGGEENLTFEDNELPF